MEAFSPIPDAVAAFVTGVLSGLGIGGGTLLVLYLTLFAGVDQRTAQGVNLAYFVPTALGSLFLHAKKGRVDVSILIPASLAGAAAALAASFAARQLDLAALRRLFGVLLLYIGVREVFARK